MILNLIAAGIKTSNVAVSGKSIESINITTMSTNTAKRSESVDVLVKTEKTNYSENSTMRLTFYWTRHINTMKVKSDIHMKTVSCFVYKT